MIRNKALGIGAAAIISAVGAGGLWGEARAGGEACRLAALCERLGPPLVCHPFDIGDAKSIAFGKGALDKSDKAAPAQVVNDTLAVLKTADSTLVRMETIRRAAVYAQSNPRIGSDLLAKLAWIALDQQANPKAPDTARAAAWFDAGFFAACLGQIGVDLGWKPGYAEGVQGYAWIQKALQLSGSNPEMEFGAALATHPAMLDSRRDLFEGHIRAAAAGLGSDPLLAKNMNAHLSNWGESVDKIVKAGGGAQKTEQADARTGRGK